MLVQDFTDFDKRIAMQGIITEPRSILHELINSRENGNVIGIWSSSLYQATAYMFFAIKSVLMKYGNVGWDTSGNSQTRVQEQTPLTAVMPRINRQSTSLAKNGTPHTYRF